MISDQQLAAMVQSELDAAEGVDGADADATRKAALNYYYGRPRGDEREGKSKLQSEDLADMVEAIVAQMMPGMAQETTAEFVPQGEADEDQAELESQAVDDAIWQDNPGFVTLVTACKDALLMRFTVFLVWMDKATSRHTEALKNISTEALALALQPEKPLETVELVSKEEVGDGVEGKRWDATVHRTFTHERLRVENIAPEDFRYAADHDKPTLDGIRFAAHRMTPTRSELQERGLSRRVVNALPRWDGSTNSTRLQRGGTNQTPTTTSKAAEQVEVWRCYYVVDMNNDGITELWRVDMAGGRVVEKEETPFMPYGMGVTTVRPHRPEGISEFDRLQQIQDLKTHGLREWADNLREGNQPRVGVVENQVNLLDYANGRPYVRIKSADSMVPLPTRDIGPSVLPFLEWGDRMRSERGGASLDLQGAGAQLQGQTAHGTERQYSAREMLAAMKARTFAETALRELVMLVHRTIRTYRRAPIELKRAGEWQTTDPREWAERSRLQMSVGLSMMERQQRLTALQTTVQMQVAALQQGKAGILTDDARLHRAVVDYGAAAGLSAPEKYWIDPSSPPAQQAAQQQQQQQMLTQQAQEQREGAILNATWALERYKVDTEYRFKYLDAALDAEIEEAKLTGQAGLQLELQQLQMRLAGNVHGARAAVDSQQATPAGNGQ